MLLQLISTASQIGFSLEVATALDNISMEMLFELLLESNFFWRSGANVLGKLCCSMRGNPAPTYVS